MQHNLLPKLLKKTSLFLEITGLVVAFDQFLKYKIHHNGGFYLCNGGISFGITLFGVFFWPILALFLLIILFYCVFLYKKRDLLYIELISLALLLGGTLSNLLDRFLFGCVLDYIDFLKPFPVFNLADVSIFSGSCLIVLFL